MKVLRILMGVMLLGSMVRATEDAYIESWTKYYYCPNNVIKVDGHSIVLDGIYNISVPVDSDYKKIVIAHHKCLASGEDNKICGIARTTAVEQLMKPRCNKARAKVGLSPINMPDILWW